MVLCCARWAADMPSKLSDPLLPRPPNPTPPAPPPPPPPPQPWDGHKPYPRCDDDSLIAWPRSVYREVW